MATSDPSAAAIEAAIREILEGAQLDQVTHGIIRGKLEERFKVDLTTRKPFIKELTIRIISEKAKSENQEEDEEEEAEDEEEEGAEEEEEEEEEERTSRGSKKRSRGGGGGFAAMVEWSDKMAEFLGTDQMPRTQVTKFLWTYIKQHDLQKPGDKRIILCDDALQRLFGVKQINMLQMPKAVNKHAVPTDGYDDVQEDDDDDEEEDSKGKVKKESGKKKAAPSKDKGPAKKKQRNMPKEKLSPELQAVVGTPTAARTEVIKLLWEYIKSNNLQNPADKRQIMCDATLKKVFGKDSVGMFAMNKLLGQHFLGKA